MSGKRTVILTLCWIILILAFSLTQIACSPHVGVGVSVGVPGPYYGPWGPSIYVGGPVFY